MRSSTEPIGLASFFRAKRRATSWRRRGPQRERMNRSAHRGPENRIDHAVLLDDAFAGELRGDDYRLEMIAAARRVSHLDMAAGQCFFDHCSDFFSIHRAVSAASLLIPDSLPCSKGGPRLVSGAAPP